MIVAEANNVGESACAPGARRRPRGLPQPHGTFKTNIQMLHTHREWNEYRQRSKRKVKKRQWLRSRAGWGHAIGAYITHICRNRNKREEVNRYWTLRGEGGLTDTYHGVKEFQNSLGVADTRRHRDTERQDRLLHRYLHPSVQPHPGLATTRSIALVYTGYFAF